MEESGIETLLSGRRNTLITRQVSNHATKLTAGQGDLQPVTDAYRMVDNEKQYVVPTGAAFERFRDATKAYGTSNLFLVDAPIDVQAILVSSDALAGYRSVNFPVTLNQPNPPRGNNWLFVHLGIAGSSPVRFFVDSVLVDKGKIRFNYHRNPIGMSSMDIYYYCYWVPLGKLEDGVYNLELYDSAAKVVTLLRRVEVATKRF
jgi:hypothetical protein